MCVVDVCLVLGVVLFGMGWGWVGYCLGFVIVGLVVGLCEVFWFVLVMFVGFWLYDCLVCWGFIVVLF